MAHARAVRSAPGPAGRFGDAVRIIGPLALVFTNKARADLTGNTVFADGGGHINGVPGRPKAKD